MGYLFKTKSYMVDQNSPGTFKGQSEEHMICNVVGKIIALVRGARDLLPGNTAPISSVEHE
jgi:hypothetical protein